MKARTRGVQGMMTTFPFYFGCTLGEFALKHTDNLSRALQDSSMSAAQMQEQRLAEDAYKTLSKARNEAAFDLFWARLPKKKSEVDGVAEPQLPRKRRLDIADFLNFFQSLRNARKLILSEICTLGKLVLVIPATNAVSERSFSVLKRIKTYLRSTTEEARLNQIIRFHVHKDLADGTDILEVANLFVGYNQRRKHLFGKISQYDPLMKSVFASKATQTV